MVVGGPPNDFPAWVVAQSADIIFNVWRSRWG